MKLGRISVATVAALAAIGLAACGSGTPGGSSGGGGGATGGSGEAVKVGIKFDQPGMGLKEGNTYSGFDVDLANYIAKELNFTPTFVEAISAQRETLIKSGQVKYIVGTYSITDARKKDVDFAGPYFIAGQDLLVRKDDTSMDAGKTALKGKKVCSATGSTPIQKVKDENLTEPGNISEFKTYSECVSQLLDKKVDAVTTDDAILKGYAANAPGELRVVGKPFSTEKYGIGVPLADKALREKVNAGLETAFSDGTWKSLYDETLGKSGAAATAPPLEKY